MGYYLQAFICKQSDCGLWVKHFDKAVPVAIDQGLSLIPMTDELFDQINNSVSSHMVNRFEYLTEYTEQQVLHIMQARKFAYVEAEYFGGEGGQIAIVWSNHKREQFLDFGQDRINQVLMDFGVIANNGQDEFLTLGFGLRRNTREWIEGPNHP